MKRLLASPNVRILSKMLFEYFCTVIKIYNIITTNTT